MGKLYRVRYNPNRPKLQYIHERHALSEIRTLPNMTIVEERNYQTDSDATNDCWWYLFENSNAQRLGLRVINDLKAEVWMRPHADPAADSVVAYMGNEFRTFRNVRQRVPMHVGKIIAIEGRNIQVRSKFGDGDIFDHSLESVPFAFGDYAKFVFIEGLFD